jgi:hypothetical protein
MEVYFNSAHKHIEILIPEGKNLKDINEETGEEILIPVKNWRASISVGDRAALSEHFTQEQIDEIQIISELKITSLYKIFMLG